MFSYLAEWLGYFRFGSSQRAHIHVGFSERSGNYESVSRRIHLMATFANLIDCLGVTKPREADPRGPENITACLDDSWLEADHTQEQSCPPLELRVRCNSYLLDLYAGEERALNFVLSLSCLLTPTDYHSARPMTSMVSQVSSGLTTISYRLQ
jgi:hypothetical protein